MLIDFLTGEDKDFINNYIDDYALEGMTKSPGVSIDHLLRYWDKNKQTLFKMFNNQLILTKQISYNKDVTEIASEIEKALFWWRDSSIFVQEFRKMTSCEGMYPYNYDLDDLIDSNTLAENIYSGSSFNIKLPSGETLQINHGCKVSKVLGKIAKGCGLNGYEEFRIKHSQILNQKTLKGTLCISIHPVDYITMSHNECNWTSCMDWTDGGEYRRGTIEMMNSNAVIVAYLASEHPMMYEDYAISNKKWRELFVVNKDIITGIKGYPYFNADLEKSVTDWLKELAQTNLDWSYEEPYFKYHVGLKDYHEELNRYLNISFETTSMYNDFSTIHHYAYVSPNINEIYHFNYSGPAICLKCGKNESEIYFDGEDSLICEDCCSSGRCDSCRSRYSSDELYELDGNLYCEECFNYLSVNCRMCETACLADNTTDIRLANKEKNIIYGRYIAIPVCDSCFKAISRQTAKDYFIGRLYSHSQYTWSSIDYVYVEECTEEGLSLFGIDSMEELADYEDSGVVKLSIN